MIKFLLTSAGITNQSIHGALLALLGKPINECNALFIPTAIYPFHRGAFMAGKAFSGNVGSPLTQLGWKTLGLLELTALPTIDKKTWLRSVEDADALLVWGGDPIYLSYWLSQSGLIEVLNALGLNLVYVGVSAGSMAVTPTIGETYQSPPNGRIPILTSEDIIFDTPDGQINRTFVTALGTGLVDFALIPHFQNKDHPDASTLNAAIWAARLPLPVYAIDDQTAIKVIGAKTEVISDGHWQLFTP